MARGSRIQAVRERVLQIRRENPDLPVKAVARWADVRIEMARRILGERLPPNPKGRTFALRREYFSWKRADKASAVLAKILHEKHPLREGARP